MKTQITYSLLAALAATGMALGAETAYTTPVGYTTETLTPGFNLIGITLQTPTLAQGVFTSNDSVSLTASSANFTGAGVVVSSGNYILEMLSTSGKSGTVVEVPGTSFSATTISGLTGISASYLGGYKVRNAATISGTFGVGATCVLKKGTSSTADLVYVPNGSGGFVTFFHSADVTVPVPAAGKWQQVGGGSTDRAATPLSYVDGLYVQVRGTTVNLTISGEVKLQSTSLPALTGFSYFGGIYPVGSTLGSSNLKNSVQKGTSSTADLIYLPDGSGGFVTYYHSADVTVPVPAAGKWQQVGGGSTDRANVPFTSGFILQRKGASVDMTLSSPVSYSNL